MLTPQQVTEQSKGALRQWREIWEKHAKIAAGRPQPSIQHFEGSGAGRACLLIANGGSVEKEIETIRKYQENVDILVCDKALGHCLKHGIKPTFCLVADANVSFEKYCEPYKELLKDTILFSSVVANPKWAEVEWKEIYYYCVKDAIHTENIFQPMSGCPNVIAAGTNVSNLLLIFVTQCDNEGSKNFFGYDKYLLIGFDYCWLWNGPYYAFDYEAGGKQFYMRHNYGRTIGGDYCYTSNNLGFSMKWLMSYIKSYRIPVVQCSADSVLPTPNAPMGAANLAEQMQYRGRLCGKDHAALIQKIRAISEEKRKLVEMVKAEKREQYLDFAASV